MASRWELETTFRDDADISINASAFDPQFHKLKFLPAEENLKIHDKIQALALQARGIMKKKCSCITV